MPPRHTYWTILFDNKPTAFRTATQEELLPTFKQIQAKHPDAVMKWFARGKLWRSEEEARAAFERPRFDRPPRPSAFAPKPTGPGDGETPPKPGGRGGESENRRQKPSWRDRPQGDRPQGDRPRGPKPEWREKPRFDRPPGQPKPAWQNRGPKPEWRDKPRDDRPRGPKPEWRDKPRDDRPSGPKPAWQNRGPKPRGGEGGQNRGPKPEWRGGRDKQRDDRTRGPRPDWKDKPRFDRPPGSPPGPPKPRSGEGGKPRSGEGWKPRSGEGGREKPRGPKPESRDKPRDEKLPAGDRRGRDWRPGGQHKDPRDRFKVPRDVKRARFKQNMRRDRNGPPPKKRDDEE